jgi:uncharacterized delta-60 repeat protein
MAGTGKCKNRHNGALVVLLLFILGLTCLALPEAAESRVSNGAWVAPEWARRYIVPETGGFGATATAVDGQGNVYVTGESYTTIKYRADGETVWVRRYNGPVNSYAAATALAMDHQGNVYVTGFSKDSGTDFDYVTIKYSPDGEELWVQRYNGPANGEDLPWAIAVDGQGNVLVTGYSETLYNTWGDNVTIKYNPEGQQLWLRRIEEVVSFNASLAVDGQGNVYVTGTLESDWCYFTVKYDPDGQRLWQRRYLGPYNGGSFAYAMALDAQGNVYVTGYSDRWDIGVGFATIKYSADGRQLWVRHYYGPGNSAGGTALAVDGRGNVYVTGVSERFQDDLYRGADYATIKYSTDGLRLWVRHYNGPGDGRDEPKAIALDAQGNVYVTGFSEGAGTGSDYATIKYSPDGKRLWVSRYTGHNTGWYGWDSPYAMAVDARGNVVVTGASAKKGAEPGFDYFAIKYTQTPP